jgi:hypothetical protein
VAHSITITRSADLEILQGRSISSSARQIRNLKPTSSVSRNVEVAPNDKPRSGRSLYNGVSVPPKEYHRIEASIDHPSIRSGAPWGFVVFRTVYGADSDAPFALLLENLQEIKMALEHHEEDHLFSHYELTVVEDEKLLRGADSHAVRDAFRAWVVEDLTPRLKNMGQWGGESQVRAKLRSNDPHWDDHPAIALPTRWKYCLFVDSGCLRSMSEFVGTGLPYVKLLNTDWEGHSTVSVAEDWEDGESDNEHEDVGWMYMAAHGHVDMYSILMRDGGWESQYERPYKGFIDDSPTLAL